MYQLTQPKWNDMVSFNNFVVRIQKSLRTEIFRVSPERFIHEHTMIIYHYIRSLKDANSCHYMTTHTGLLNLDAGKSLMQIIMIFEYDIN